MVADKPRPDYRTPDPIEDLTALLDGIEARIDALEDTLTRIVEMLEEHVASDEVTS